MKKVLLLFGMVSACAGNTKTQAPENDSIAIVKEVADTMSVDTLGCN